MSEEEAGQTTSYGLWRYGNDFREAAEIVAADRDITRFTPYYFLIGQSIELSLKAFLLGNGVPLDELKHPPLGHDLHALLQEALKRDLDNEVEVDRVQCGVVRLLSFEYKSRRFQYLLTGTIHLADAWRLQGIAEKLSEGLEEYCKRTKD